MPENKESADPFRANARELLAKAEAELGEQKRSEPKLPERPFVTGVASFLFDPQAGVRWCVFTLWSHVLIRVLYGVFYFADAGVLQVASIGLVAILAVLGMPFVLWFSGSCLAITRDTANGCETIESWPGLDFTECLSAAPYAVLSSSAAIFPGYVIGQVFLWSGAPIWAMFLACTLTLLIFYPVILLSMLKSGSPIAMLSPAVIQSMNSSLGTWLRYYALSGCLGALAALAVWLNWITGFVLGLFCAIPMIAVTMIYHRLMGRLAWVIQTQSEKERVESKPTDD
jgi:hypothetical protein